MRWRHLSVSCSTDRYHAECFRRSLRQAAYITPLPKKPVLDPSAGKSYRPISSLTVLSKVLERLVARQLVSHLSEWKLLPELQSAYRAYHAFDLDCSIPGNL